MNPIGFFNEDERSLTDWELTLLFNERERKYRVEFVSTEPGELHTVDELVKVFSWNPQRRIADAGLQVNRVYKK